MAAEFDRIQKKLNNDKGFRERFLKDPVEAVKSEGITTTPQHEEALKKFVQKIQTQPPQPSGSSTTAGINGGIAISISF